MNKFNIGEHVRPNKRSPYVSVRDVDGVVAEIDSAGYVVVQFSQPVAESAENPKQLLFYANELDRAEVGGNIMSFDVGQKVKLTNYINDGVGEMLNGAEGVIVRSAGAGSYLVLIDPQNEEQAWAMLIYLQIIGDPYLAVFENEMELLDV